MVRWEPDGSGRLRAAAMKLFLDQGFEQTTTAEIAASVGLTERTFFRHFADKREVLFEGQERFQQVFLDGIAGVPAGEPPMVMVAAALRGAAGFFSDERRESSRLRQTVIAAHPALQERELLKLAGLATALAAALRDRDVPEPAATLTAESAVTVFRVAFGGWIAEGEDRSLGELADEALAQLRTLTATPAGLGV